MTSNTNTTPRKYTALKVVSCCAILSVGVFSNLPSLSSSDVVSSSPCLRGRPVAETMFMLSANETTNYAGFQPEASDEDDDGVKLDFVVAGFPKCGTTTLLKTFDQHEGEIAWRDDKLSSMHGLILFHQSNSLSFHSLTQKRKSILSRNVVWTKFFRMITRIHASRRT